MAGMRGVAAGGLRQPSFLWGVEAWQTKTAKPTQQTLKTGRGLLFIFWAKMEKQDAVGAAGK
jgi:hypothetical protein